MNARADLGTLEASGLIQVATIQPELEYTRSCRTPRTARCSSRIVVRFTSSPPKRFSRCTQTAAVSSPP